MNFDSAPGQHNSEPKKINGLEIIDFLQAENFDDLYKLVRLQGGLKGSSEEYSPEQLIEIIEKVKNGEFGLKVVTRTNDLQLAVKKILENSQEKIN